MANPRQNKAALRKKSQCPECGVSKMKGYLNYHRTNIHGVGTAGIPCGEKLREDSGGGARGVNLL